MCQSSPMPVPQRSSSDHSVAPAVWEERVLDRSLGDARNRLSASARRLVDAARALAGERGSTEFTVAEVADRAGVAVRSFYRQFGGREELVLALFEEEARQGADILAEALRPVPEPLERVHRYVVELCGLLVTGSGYASLLVRECLRIGEHRPDELRAALAPMVDLLEAELHAAAAAGSMRAVDRHDAVVLFTSLLAHVHVRVLAPEIGEHAAERMWAFFRSALDAEGEQR